MERTDTQRTEVRGLWRQRSQKKGGFERPLCPKVHNLTHWPACLGLRFWGRAAQSVGPRPYESEGHTAGSPDRASSNARGGVGRQLPPSSQCPRALVCALLMTSGVELSSRLSLQAFPVSNSPLPGFLSFNCLGANVSEPGFLS